jgi:hypothetical protein
MAYNIDVKYLWNMIEYYSNLSKKTYDHKYDNNETPEEHTKKFELQIDQKHAI